METWGDKPKSQVDPSTVDEQIAADIQNHLDDPDAHLETGQSLQSHKASEIIDHLAESVLNDKLEPRSRSFICIVDPEGNGDFVNIQDAIDYADGKGGGDILLVAGVHAIDYDIVFKPKIQLVGIGVGVTTLDFQGGTNQILGYPVFKKTMEEIGVTNGSPTVTAPDYNGFIDNGVVPGLYFDAESFPDKRYIVASVESNTSLTLTENYAGVTEENIFDFHEGVFPKNIISDLSIINCQNDGFAVDCENGLGIDMNDIIFDNCKGIYSNGGYPFYYYSNFVHSNIHCRNCSADILFNAGVGIWNNLVTFECRDVGIVFANSGECIFNGCDVKASSSTECALFSGNPDEIKINASLFQGFDLFSVAGDSCGDIYATNTFFNSGASGDLDIDVYQSLFSACRFKAGYMSKVNFPAGANYNVFCGNRTNYGITDSGTGNVIANNLTY